MSAVLGLDPGSHKFGWAIVEGVNDWRRYRVIAYGTLLLRKKGAYEHIYQSISRIIDEYKPELIGIEKPFIHAKHRLDTIMPLCQARGAAVAACQSKGIEPIDLMPSVVKKNVTGRGNADKELVAKYVKLRTGADVSESMYDETDAIAIAMTAIQVQQ